MSYAYLDENMQICNISKSKYLTIEAYDIAEYTSTLLKYGMDFKISESSNLYPRYFPPRYMVTLVRNKTYKEPKETEVKQKPIVNN